MAKIDNQQAPQRKGPRPVLVVHTAVIYVRNQGLGLG